MFELLLLLLLLSPEKRGRRRPFSAVRTECEGGLKICCLGEDAKEGSIEWEEEEEEAIFSWHSGIEPRVEAWEEISTTFIDM